MIGTDETTRATELLAVPWPICRACGGQHPPEDGCDPVGSDFDLIAASLPTAVAQPMSSRWLAG